MEPLSPFFFIVGPAEHGKSTFRKALSEALGLKGGSCSDYLYSLWAYVDEGVTEVELRAKPKPEVRPELVALGNWITTPSASFRGTFPFSRFPTAKPERLNGTGVPLPHRAALVQAAAWSGVRVLDGIRRKSEIESALVYFAWFGVRPTIVWIEDPRKGRTPGDNLDIDASWSGIDVHVENGGSVEGLQEYARHFAKNFVRV